MKIKERLAYIKKDCIKKLNKQYHLEHIELIKGMEDIVLEHFLLEYVDINSKILVVGDDDFIIRNVLKHYNYPYAYQRHFHKDKHFDYIFYHSKDFKKIEKINPHKLILMDIELLDKIEVDISDVCLCIGRLNEYIVFYNHNDMQINTFDTDAYLFSEDIISLK